MLQKCHFTLDCCNGTVKTVAMELQQAPMIGDTVVLTHGAFEITARSYHLRPGYWQGVRLIGRELKQQ